MPPASTLIRRSDTRAIRSQCLLHWRARDISLNSVSGQSFTLSRAATRTATDSGGATVTAVHSMPAWSVQTLYDGVAYGMLATGAADRIVSASVVPAPGACTVLVELTQTAAGVTTDYFVSISNDAVTGARFIIYGTSTNYVVEYHDGTNSRTSTVARVTGDNGKLIRLRATLSAAGVVQLWRTIDGGAETAGTASASLTLAAWPTGAVWRINHHGASSNGVAGAYRAVKVATGTQSLATMDAVI